MTSRSAKTRGEAKVRFNGESRNLMDVGTISVHSQREIIAFDRKDLWQFLTQFEAIQGKRREWRAPLATCLSILATFVTTDFQNIDRFGIKASDDTLTALFLFFFLASFALLAVSAVRSFHTPSLSVDEQIEKMKEGSVTLTAHDGQATEVELGGGYVVFTK